MNKKNNLGLESCFMDEDDPFVVFKHWMLEAEKNEINDPNAVALATVNESNQPDVRMVLLKEFDSNGFIFFTNLNSKKGTDLKKIPKASMCFHWKSLRRQVRVIGKVEEVSANEADNYFNSRPYKNRIGAWASSQSQILDKRETFTKKIKQASNESKIELAICLVKKTPMETILQKSTELGVSKIIPIVSERTEVKDLNYERAWSTVIRAINASQIISNDRNREEGIFYVSLSAEDESNESRFNPFSFLRRNPSEQIADPEYIILVSRSGSKTLIKAEAMTGNIQDAEDLLSILNESLS